MENFQTSFSDDSLMVNNEEAVEEVVQSSAQLTMSESPVRDEPRSTGEAKMPESPVKEEPSQSAQLIAFESPEKEEPELTAQLTTSESPVLKIVVAGQDGDVNVASGPALIEAEAYADRLAREIINDQLVRSSVEQQQQKQPTHANLTFETTHDADKATAPQKTDTSDNDKENRGPETEPTDVGNSSRSSSNSDVANREESHWEYKSVLKEIATDSGNRETSLPIELQQDNFTPEVTESAPKPDPVATMEFAKNYSDDLLMGQNEGGQAQAEPHATSADLADFELPPYSGSSSGSSEPAPRQQSPTTTIKAQSSTSTAGLSPPNLTALRDLLKSNYSQVSHIFHWKKPIESGVCFTIGVSIIIALTFFSIISVVAYSTLGLMLASGSIRLYKTVMKTLNKSTDTPVDNIWNKVQALNVNLSQEKMHELVDSSLGNLNSSLTYFKQVLLVQDKIATLKFGIFVYFLTYIGSWFNGMTLITICYLGLFSVPILYEKNKSKIDEIFNIATGHLCSATSTITNKVGSLVSGSSGSTDKKQD